MATKIDNKDYPNIRALCKILSACLLKDRIKSDNGSQKTTVYFLGEFDQCLSGIPKQILTPYFKTIDELESWCKDRRTSVSKRYPND